MKFSISKLVACFLIVSYGIAEGAHTKEETDKFLWTLMKHRSSYDYDNFPTLEPFYRPDFENPDVFFGMKTDGHWTRAEKEAAFDDFLNNMWRIDHSVRQPPYTPNPLVAISQCVEMHYTNAVPAIRRYALNPTLPEWVRGRAIRSCIVLSPVEDSMTDFIETIYTNRMAYTWKIRRSAFDYGNKVTAMKMSNLVSRAVCDRAAMMIHRGYSNEDWQFAATYDGFMVRYFDDYASSSNRLAFLCFVLQNTNITQNVNKQVVKERFISFTNQLLSADQPLNKLNLEEEEQ